MNELGIHLIDRKENEMFLKLTNVRDGKKVLVNMAFVALVTKAPVGTYIAWGEPDLEVLTVSERLEEIQALLAEASK